MTCRVEQGTTYVQNYNSENRLSSVDELASGTCTTPLAVAAAWNFIYDGDGTRVAQLYTSFQGGTQQTPVLTAYFLGGAYEISGNMSGSTFTQTRLRKYYSIGGMLVAMLDSTDATGLKYPLTDQQGSVVALTDSSGILSSQQRYLPFGQVRSDIGSITQTDFGYTGQRNITYINLLDYRSRWFDPEAGRFISPDTVVPGGPQGLNRYSYVSNDPIGMSDPTGHCEVSGSNVWIPDGTSLCSGGASAGDGKTVIDTPAQITKKQPKGAATGGKCPKLSDCKPSPQETVSTPVCPGITCPAPLVYPNTSFPSFPHPTINVDVDWSQVDKIDASIDGSGTALDLIAIASIGIGQPEIAVGVDAVGKIVDLAGTAKAGYDLFANHNANPLVILADESLITKNLESKLAWRGESDIPILGVVGNGVNLYHDLNPTIEVQWVNP